MSEFFFVFKTVLFSALVLMLLQLRLGETTLEQKAEGWIYQSRLGNEMQTVARGAIRAGREGFVWASDRTSEIADSIETKEERFSTNRSR